jgi:hypothetical protein
MGWIASEAIEALQVPLGDSDSTTGSADVTRSLTASVEGKMSHHHARVPSPQVSINGIFVNWDFGTDWPVDENAT